MWNKTKSIEEKIKCQAEAVTMLNKSRRILLSWCTGVGKTLGSLKMIEKYYNYKPTIKGYIICKETTHLSNWDEDIMEHGMGFIHGITEKFLYASVKKYSDRGFVDFVILDECHAITPARAEHLKMIIGPETLVIALSATVDVKKAALLHEVCKGKYSEYHISITEAINRGILPAPVVVIHSLSLGKHQEEYDRLTAQVNKYGNDYEASSGDKWKHIKWVNAGAMRKMAMSEMKTVQATKIIKEFGDSRFICFSGTKWQAEELAMPTDNYVHSGNSAKENQAKKDEFNNEEINSLFVVNMMREAINLVKVEKGLIVQLDSVKLSFVQMLGRVFRSDLPEMHIMVYKNTQDAIYLRRVMKGFPVKYVKTLEY